MSPLHNANQGSSHEYDQKSTIDNVDDDSSQSRVVSSSLLSALEADGAPRCDITQRNGDISPVDDIVGGSPTQNLRYSAVIGSPAQAMKDTNSSPLVTHDDSAASPFPPPTDHANGDLEVGSRAQPIDKGRNFFLDLDEFPDAPIRTPLLRTRSQLEEGGIRAQTEDSGMLPNLLSLYGFSSRPRSYSSSTLAQSISLSRANSDTSTTFETLGTLGLKKRHDSVMSTGTNLLEPEDPRVSGGGINKHDIKMLRKKRKLMSRHATIEDNVVSLMKRREFVLKLAKALIFFGAPSHRIESQLVAASNVLELTAHFVHLPNVVICTFGDPNTKTTQTQFVKANGRIMLGRLHSIHNIYRMVCRDEISAETGTIELCKLLKSPPIYGLRIRVLLAFLCASFICPMAFGGTIVDMGIAGVCGAGLTFLQLYAAKRSSMYADVFEISIAVLVSFIARVLAGIPGQKFCYQAISSSGVVLILPGYLILVSSLELASKNMLCGSVRMVYAIIYSLFLGFGLTLGSDLGFLVNGHVREQVDISSRARALDVHITGNYSFGYTSEDMYNGTFSYTNATHALATNVIKGCYRNPEWAWYYKPFPEWTLVFLVPLYTFFSTSSNLQPWRSKQLPAMILISCCSFAANRFANHYIFGRSDIVSFIGAFVVGILGNLYSRIFGGTAFTAMLPGVLTLVPSGLAAAGGLAQNYRGKNSDLYSASITIGCRMVEVAIGITVGLFTSGLLIYAFGRRKKSALFAF